MNKFAIKVSITIQDGLSEPFGGSAWVSQGVTLNDALYVCRSALLAAGYNLDRLVAFDGENEFSDDKA